MREYSTLSTWTSPPSRCRAVCRPAVHRGMSDLAVVKVSEACLVCSAVRSFGTEGRRADGPQVPPSNETYEFIIFRGASELGEVVLRGWQGAGSCLCLLLLPLLLLPLSYSL
jgi:hypothetical protein